MPLQIDTPRVVVIRESAQITTALSFRSPPPPPPTNPLPPQSLPLFRFRNEVPFSGAIHNPGKMGVRVGRGRWGGGGGGVDPQRSLRTQNRLEVDQTTKEVGVRMRFLASSLTHERGQKRDGELNIDCSPTSHRERVIPRRRWLRDSQKINGEDGRSYRHWHQPATQTEAMRGEGKGEEVGGWGWGWGWGWGGMCVCVCVCVIGTKG